MEISTDIFVMGSDANGDESPMNDEVYTNISEAIEQAHDMQTDCVCNGSSVQVFVSVVITIYGGDIANGANLCYTTDFDINGNITRTE